MEISELHSMPLPPCISWIFKKQQLRSVCQPAWLCRFKGDISRYKTEDYFNTLDDLVAKGSLVQICDKKVYAVPSEVKVINAKVKAVEDPLLKGIDDVKHYSYVISDDTGKEYHLNTDLVIMPNDEVEAIATKSSDIAFVKNLIKVRQCVLGRIMLFGKKKASLMPDEANLKEMFLTLLQNLI